MKNIGNKIDTNKSPFTVTEKTFQKHSKIKIDYPKTVGKNNRLIIIQAFGFKINICNTNIEKSINMMKS